MLPGVVVLRVDIQDGLGELQLERRVVEPLDNHPTVMPNLVVFRVVLQVTR